MYFTRRSLLTLLLPLLLVFAQQAGFWHELSHFNAPAQTPGSSQKGKQAPGHGACGECASFAHLAGAIPNSIVVLTATAASFIPLHLTVIATVATRPSLHRNRGPPVLL